MRLLFVNGVHWTGGAETWLVDLARELQARGHEVRVAHDPRSPLGRRARAAGVETVPVRARRLLTRGLRLASSIRARPCDLVVATARRDVLPVGLAARLSGGLPVVARIMNGWRPGDGTGGSCGWRDGARRRLHSGLVHFAIANSRAGEARLVARRDLPPARVAAIHNGVDPTRFDPERTPRGRLRGELGIPPEAFLAVSISRFDQRKGRSVELEAIGRLVSSRPDVHAVLAGPVRGRDLQYRARLVARAASFPGAGRIHFLGERDDVPAILADADVLLRCAIEEGLPNIALEAMAMGVPVVATAICATPEAVVDGETGRLVAAGDPDAVFGALSDLVRSPAQRGRMGAAGRERVRRLFRLDRMVSDYERLFLRVAGAPA